MLRINRYTKKVAAILTATALALAPLMALAPQSASAGQVTARSIKLSTSSTAASAATTAYSFLFTTTSTYTGKGIVVDFCSNSPIIGDTTCTAPTGFSLASATITTNSAPMNSSAWTIGTLNTNRTLTLTNATGVAFTNATIADFTINLVQNPTTACTGVNCTFYARIYTYTTSTAPALYTVANPDAGTTHTDDGGVAISTANQVTVTAKVQESLLFCVFTSAGPGCSGSTVAGIPLGDANGVLSGTTTSYVGATTAKLGLASNASTGVTVNAKGVTLTSPGAFTIDPTNAGAGTCFADSATSSLEQYGFRVTAAVGGTGTQNLDAGYSCASVNHSWDTTNLATTYGDRVMYTSGPNTEAATTAVGVEFQAKSSTASEPGVYTSTMTFIATGIY